MTTDPLSGDRFAVDYRLAGPESHARTLSERLCADQTIEAPLSLLRLSPIPTGLLGTVAGFFEESASCYRATVSFPVELFGHSCAQLLHTLFGTASLTPGIQVAAVHLPDTLPQGWPGPRFGISGLRELARVPHRPLVCGVLKPLGYSPKLLADLARSFALGGVDLIKDDQGLGDHTFCRFEERVSLTVAAIQDATCSTARPCLYFPHVVGSLDDIRRQAAFAKQAGAGGILLSPGLVGYEALHELSRQDELALPIMSHPAFLGTYAMNSESGLAPNVLYGQLPRLAGADVTIYPTYGPAFPITPHDCFLIGAACTQPWGPLRPMFPTAAGRMDQARISEMCGFYGHEFVFILGSQIRETPDGIIVACRQFIQNLS